MEDKILLATYLIRIRDNENNPQILSYFNGSDDFLDTFHSFTQFIYSNVNQLSDSSGRHKIHLTLEEPAVFEKNNRRIYGYFSSGVSGEKYTVKDINTNETEMLVERHHAAFRNVFFYFYVPKGKNVGYLILQRKSNFGIKTKLKPAINSYIKQEGYQIYNILIHNVLHNSVYQRMMRDGKLKKVDLIKRKIPNSIEDYIHNDKKAEEIKGTFRSSFSSRTSLPEHWKDYINKLFKNTKDKNETVEINNLDENFEDLEFQLELNGKKKTFYIKNKQRIQPDIDVTANVAKDEYDEPTLESLVTQAEELIQDLLDIKPKNDK